MSNETIYIEPPKSTGRRLVMSDIHGCSKTFLAMLDKINFAVNDQLFILGDCINRGKHSKSVVKIIMNLQRLGCEVFALRGNHEQNMLAMAKNDNLEERLAYFKKHDTFGFMSGKGELKKKYRNFFQEMPYYCKLDNRYLVHAGFDFDGNPFADIKSMLTIRSMCADSVPAGIQIIHGHTPVPLSSIMQSVEENSPVIGIDNGCMLRNFRGYGNLVCLDLDAMSIVAQPNID